MDTGKEGAKTGGSNGDHKPRDFPASSSNSPAKITEQLATSVTISPATSNKNLKFTGNAEQFFQTTTLRSAFQEHAAFRAVFRVDGEENTASNMYPWEKEKKPKLFPGQIVAHSEDFNGKRVSKTERGSTDKAFAVKGAKNGLITTIMTAYNQHCNLVISPDDVWLTILAQFSAYVNKNAEGLRGRIVEHEGKKDLLVHSAGTLFTADYKGMINDLLGEIKKNIKSPDLADWFRPGFSTTTERDEVCAAAAAMGTLQAYFGYKMWLMCGIPAVTLMGTVADWKLLREKIERLLEFEIQDSPDGNVMELWVGYLRKVCDGFVESAEHPDSPKTLEFWDKVLSHVGGGSGPRYITGWLSAFTCFDKDGKFIGRKREFQMRTHIGDRSETVMAEFPLIDTNDICDNIVSCPVKIDDNGVEYDGTLFTGQVVFEAEQDKIDVYPTLRPRNDWCMAVAVK